MRVLLGRFAAFGALSILLTACGGRAINKKTAQDIIAGQGLFKEKAIDIESVSQTSPGQAVVQAKIPAAFRLEKTHGQWEIREVRLGNNQWEKLDNILFALNKVKAEETKKMLDQVASAIELFRERNGRLPDFRDYVSLSDALSPEFLRPLVRLDAWGRPLIAIRIGPETIKLLSTGPDGKVGTEDDVVLTRSYPSQKP